MAKNQNRIRNRWELITCGLGGHVTYAPDDAALAARLRASTGLGEVWRCLRCGDFALGGPQGRGAPEDAPLIMRGKALRQAIIIRALGVERLVRALVLALAAWAVWEFRGARGAIQATLDRDLPVLRAAGFKVDQMTVIHALEKALAAKPSTLALITGMLAAYAVLQAVEGVGLWLLKLGRVLRGGGHLNFPAVGGSRPGQGHHDDSGRDLQHQCRRRCLPADF